MKCKSLWGERECLLIVIIYKTVVYAACNTERLYAARCHANSAHAYFDVFFPGLSDFVGSVFCLSLQVFLWHVSPVPVVFFVSASADVQLAPSFQPLLTFNLLHHSAGVQFAPSFQPLPTFNLLHHDSDFQNRCHVILLSHMISRMRKHEDVRGRTDGRTDTTAIDIIKVGARSRSPQLTFNV